MVSSRTPRQDASARKSPAPRRGDRSAPEDKSRGARSAPVRDADATAAIVEALLKQLAAQSRESLMEPWRERLAASEGLRREMGRIVANLQVFFNKWTVEIIIVLGQHGTRRFSELKGSLAGISGRTLTQRLRDLEEQGLVTRRMFDEMPVRVEYALTRKGLDVAALALPLVLYLQMER